jgi:predicted peptidase
LASNFEEKQYLSMEPLPEKAGIYGLVLGDNHQRITLGLPNGYENEQNRPLILALHWGGQRHAFIGKSILLGLMIPALEELGAILVAPDCIEDDWANPKSEKDLLNLLSFMEDNFNIDSPHTLITGYSLGGIGAWYLGARHQHRFAGVLPISASPPVEAVNAQWDIPIYVIHSRQDEYFPNHEIELSLNIIKEKGAQITIDLVDGITHFDTWNFIKPLKSAIPWIKQIWREN